MFGVSKKLILSVVLGAFLPSILLAATPTAYLERSKVIATGRQIKAYSVPTKDADGTIRYYDITINLNAAKIKIMPLILCAIRR